MKEKKVNNPFDELYYKNPFKSGNSVKTLYDLYQGNRVNLLVSLVFFIIKHSPVWVLPIVSANIINIVSKPGENSIHRLLVNVLIMLVMIIQNIPNHTLYMRFLSKAVRNMETRLRSALVRRLQQLSISFHKEFQSGRLQAKVLRDVEAVEMLSMQVMNNFLPGILSIIVALAYTVSRNKMVALFYILTVPISTLLIFTFRKDMSQRNHEFRREIEEMASKVSESIEMIPITRAHGLEKVEIKKIDHQLEKVQDKGFRLDVLNAIFGASAWVTFQVFQVLCLVVTGYMAYNRMIPVGDIVMYQGFFNTIVMAVTGIINVYPQLAKGLESIRSIGEILESPELEINQGKIRLHDVKGNFSFHNVDYQYPSAGEYAIKDFNLEVKAGECIAFVGESGAGKSTILSLIIGFLKPTAGKVVLDGIDMEDLDKRLYRRHIAVVPQNTILFSGSIRDNITYGLSSISEERLWQSLEIANATEFIKKLPQGIDTLIGEHGGKLSGGQRQRIAIARALIRDPRVIIFDEATSALDAVSEAQIQEAIKKMIEGRTTFIVAHRLSTIKDADRIVVMKEGKCLESGDFDNLIWLEGEFSKIRNIQVQG